MHFVVVLNDIHMQKVQGRISRMAWREATDLHLVNLSSLMVIEPKEIIDEWRNGCKKARRYENTDEVDTCLYGTVTSLLTSFISTL
jgi:hypothetical protein